MYKMNTTHKGTEDNFAEIEIEKLFKCFIAI